MDKTLILVKPDAFARNLTGEIIARFERKGLRIVALHHMTMDTQLAEQHYAEHDGKPFFGELVSFITSGPLVAMVLEGDEAVRAARQVIGATNPLEATTGSIRGDFAVAVGQNMVHGSDSAESAEREASAVLPRPLILASGSPQRRAILEQAGIPFEVRVSGVEEETRGDPREVALENARRKARAVDAPGELVLGADTDVALDGDILGKPRDAEAGGRVPRAPLRPHPPGRRRHRPRTRRRGPTFVEVTEVDFAPLDRSTVEWYVRSREWEGRAGGYAIQGRGAALITGIRGDYLNVVGLPLARLLKLHPDLHPATPISRGSAGGVR